MKFLLEFVGCCRSGSSGKMRPAEEKRLLVVQEPRRRVGRKPGRIRGGHVLISERINIVERPSEAGWRRSLERKVSSMSRKDRSRFSDHEDGRRPSHPTIIPTFAPTPFMF
ncbi:hypothetical protein CDL12_21365 [Handroanthus impetiginosus]|uniref:Uncharacterized protein n=1 Tax=Handroanthus impetiginosus TaxID=429701 RepID=A0A2G9GLF1_9LAMI|nr:hypothetical protein CDL12_21365 [Handroanthus impetiginosus]